MWAGLLQARSFALQVIIRCLINTKVLMSADLRCLQAEHLIGSLEAVHLQSQSVDRHNSLQTDTDLLVA